MNDSFEFRQNLEFYWRSIAVYSIVLIFYMLVFGTIEEGTFAINSTNPVVILLILIILSTSISLLYKLSRKRAIIISNNYIIFKSRFKQKKYFSNEIIEIKFSRERIFHSRRKYGIVKIKLPNRKLYVRVRPSAFENEEHLVKLLINISKKIKNN